MENQESEITRLLGRWQEGDRDALERLLPFIQRELRRIALRHLARERKGNTLQASSLVQEAFLRLLPDREQGWQNRAHFFAVASQVMRHVLVDHARAKHSQKRGAGAVHIPVDEAIVFATDRFDEVVAIDLALTRLAAVDERKSKVVEMRLFGGLSVDETAEALGVAANTVLRDWSFARAWLRRELGGATASDPSSA